MRRDPAITLSLASILCALLAVLVLVAFLPFAVLGTVSAIGALTTALVGLREPQRTTTLGLTLAWLVIVAWTIVWAVLVDFAVSFSHYTF